MVVDSEGEESRRETSVLVNLGTVPKAISMAGRQFSGIF